MKAKIDELETSFYITFDPEDLKDQTILARLGINWKKELKNVVTCASRDGKICSYVHIGKRKDSTSIIGRK
jgi:hypothetical protein